MTRPLLSLAVAVLLVPPVIAAPPVSAAAYHPQGKLVAFGTHGEVRLFDPATGEPVGTLGGQVGRVTALAFSPDGSRLAVASGEPGKTGIIRVYTVGRTDPTVVITGHQDAVYALAFAAGGNRLASAGYDRVIRIWDLSSRVPVPTPWEIRRPARELKDHSDTVYGLAFHPGGKLLASGSADRAVKVWDVETGARLYTLGDPTDWVYCVTWSPDGKHLAAAGVDRSIRVWSADEHGGKLAVAAFAHEGPVWRIGYGPGGKTLYSVGEDRVIKAWDAAKLVETKVFPAQPEAVLSLAVSPKGNQLAVGCFDGVALLLDSATGKPTAQVLPPKPVPPKAEKLSPSGGPRGTTVRVTVTGKNLDHVKKVTASLPEVRAALLPNTTADRLELDLTIPPRAAAGGLQLTFEGDAGKSPPLTFAIDRYPAVPESGITDSARAAMPVKLPVTVVGSIDRAGDVDYFRFEAKAGQEIGVQVVAAEVGSKLDPVLVITDADGRVLAEGNAAVGYTARTAGSYAVGVRDREYRGAPDMTYRLHIGDVPVITGVFPLAVPRGKTSRVHVHGVNLGSTESLMLTANPPAETAPGTKHPLAIPVNAAGDKPLGSTTVLVEEFPSAVVDPVAGADVRVPGSADGILLKPGEGQVVRFAAKKGERLVVEVLARRAGSPVDPAIEILDAAGKPVPRAVLRATAKTHVTFRDHDSAGPGIRLETWNELAIDDYLYVDGELTRILALPKNPDDDCQFYQVGGQRVGFLDTTPAHHSMGTPMYRVETHPPGSSFPPNGLPQFTLYYRNDDGGPGYGKDSRLFFNAPADGTYQVRVTDARGSGGPSHAYRVTVRPPRPDFSLSFNPTAPAVWKGGALPIGVTATRTDGFDGPIRLRLEGLPPGFHAPETFIEGNLTTTAFALFADASASVPADTKLRLVATATINGKEVVREAVGGLPKLADPGDIVTTTRQSEVVIRPGEETRLVVDIQRRNGFVGRVPVEVRGLPHGVRVLNIGLNGILITERDTSREIVIYAEPWVKPMEHPIVVLSTREGKNTVHAAKSVLLKVER
jgi:WD40 repeat protein